MRYRPLSQIPVSAPALAISLIRNLFSHTVGMHTVGFIKMKMCEDVYTILYFLILIVSGVSLKSKHIVTDSLAPQRMTFKDVIQL